MNDFRLHPATYSLAAAWVLVYAAMNVHQGGFYAAGGMGFGRIDLVTAHLFGDLTAREVAQGQIWRTITATFIHFSVLHLVFNLTCLISFGRLLETWYGKAQMLAVYVAIGAVGNSLAVIGRLVLNSGVNIPCAGGSSVMFGFIAMLAVVGWRSKTRFGDYVRRQMLGKLLIFGVVMGLIGRGVLDNFGHGGGAIAGALVGFAHRILVRSVDSPLSRVLGAVSLVILAACASAQVWADRQEGANQQRLVAALNDYQNVRTVVSMYESLANYAETNPQDLDGNALTAARNQMSKTLQKMISTRPTPSPSQSVEPFATWRALASAAAVRFPTPEERIEFRKLSVQILKDSQNRVASTVKTLSPVSLPIPRAR